MYSTQYCNIPIVLWMYLFAQNFKAGWIRADLWSLSCFRRNGGK